MNNCEILNTAGQNFRCFIKMLKNPLGVACGDKKLMYVTPKVTLSRYCYILCGQKLSSPFFSSLLVIYLILLETWA